MIHLPPTRLQRTEHTLYVICALMISDRRDQGCNYNTVFINTLLVSRNLAFHKE
jgi:hypothetical protein